MRYLVAGLLGILPFAASAQAGSVTVIVDNVEVAKGTVKVALCDKGLSSDGCSIFLTTPAVVGTVQVVFENVPPGKWAVAAFHDKNDSGEMDTLFGIPQEPYALSNDAAKNMIPTLKDAVLTIGATDMEVNLKLGRFGKQ